VWLPEGSAASARRWDGQAGRAGGRVYISKGKVEQAGRAGGRVYISKGKVVQQLLPEKPRFQPRVG